MELRQLRHMLTVAEEKSFSRAAEKLYIAQPHLSQSIQKLESQINVKLFDRASAPIKLTYAGERFARRARQILQLQSDLFQEMKDVAEENRGRLSLGISPIRGRYVLPAALPAFRARCPEVELSLYEGTTLELEARLQEGKVDLAIMPLPMKSPDFSHNALMEEEIMILLPAHHRLAARADADDALPVLPLAELAEELFILLQPGLALRRIADTLFAQAGFSPRVALETANYDTAHHLTAAGMGISFSTLNISQQQWNAGRGVRLFRCEPNFIRTLAIVYRKGKYLRKFEQDFIAITQQAIKEDMWRE